MPASKPTYNWKLSVLPGYTVAPSPRSDSSPRYRKMSVYYVHSRQDNSKLSGRAHNQTGTPATFSPPKQPAQAAADGACQFCGRVGTWECQAHRLGQTTTPIPAAGLRPHLLAVCLSILSPNSGVTGLTMLADLFRRSTTFALPLSRGTLEVPPENPPQVAIMLRCIAWRLILSR